MQGSNPDVRTRLLLIFWPNERYRESNFTLGFQVQLVLLDYSMFAASLHSTLQEE